MAYQPTTPVRHAFATWLSFAPFYMGVTPFADVARKLMLTAGTEQINRPVVALFTPVVPNDYRRMDVFRNLLTEMEGQRHGTGVEQVDAAAVDFS